MFHKATNFLRSQSFYRKYGPNLPISLTHRVSIRPKATNLGDLMRRSSGGEWTSAAVDCCLRLASATAFRGVAVDRLPGLVGGGSSGAAFDRSRTCVFDLSSGPAVGSVRLPARGIT